MLLIFIYLCTYNIKCMYYGPPRKKSQIYPKKSPKTHIFHLRGQLLIFLRAKKIPFHNLFQFDWLGWRNWKDEFGFQLFLLHVPDNVPNLLCALLCSLSKYASFLFKMLFLLCSLSQTIFLSISLFHSYKHIDTYIYLHVFIVANFPVICSLSIFSCC